MTNFLIFYVLMVVCHYVIIRAGTKDIGDTRGLILASVFWPVLVVVEAYYIHKDQKER